MASSFGNVTPIREQSRGLPVGYEFTVFALKLQLVRVSVKGRAEIWGFAPGLGHWAGAEKVWSAAIAKVAATSFHVLVTLSFAIHRMALSSLGSVPDTGRERNHADPVGVIDSGIDLKAP